MRLGSKAIVAGLAVHPSAALAGNAGHPPTQVAWPERPCLTVVDRSVDPMVTIDYAIPFEDTEVTTDEVADSRTHQFFALCESRGWHEFPPRWISEADVAAAVARGIVSAEDVDAHDVLETSERWAGCWWRITPDDGRRPITFDAAAEGVAWDTRALPVGVYVVEGYTHEPPKGQWVTRPGVYKVTDGAAGEAVGPALAVTSAQQVVYADEAVAVQGCVDASHGATLSASWAVVAEPLSFEEFVRAQPVSGDAFDLEFEPPPAARDNLVVIRVDVMQADGRSASAFMLERVTVLDERQPCDGAIGPGCQDGTSSDDDGTDDGTDDGPEVDTETQPSGCTCRGGPVAPAWGWLMLGLLALRRRTSA